MRYKVKNINARKQCKRFNTLNKGGIVMSYATYVPERFMGRTGYQIFVDRFYRQGPPPEAMEERILKNWSDELPNWWPDSDGEYRNHYFYGGNLQGIITKLDYLQEMGVDLIYHSPISKTPSSHHYDVENQTIIDPWIGTWEDYQELCKEAHKRDILICPDLVFNHMGVQSQIFQEALHNPQSKYHEWFEWDDKGNPVYWYGFKDMPQCNKLSPSYQNYCCDICEYYLKMGADGIRLDLGGNFPKEFMTVIRKRIKSINPEALIVVEMWEYATHKENPQIYGDQTDSVMNYPLADGICRLVRCQNEKHFLYVYGELRKYPEEVQNVLWNFLDSHDVPRVLTMLERPGMLENPFEGAIWDIEKPWRIRSYNGDVIGFDTYGFRKWEAETLEHVNMGLARKRLMLASLMQYSAKGIPIVYYGTEAGVTGGKDPFCRKPYPWEMQDEILMHHYKRLGKFRKKYKEILSYGAWNIVAVTNHVGIYERIGENKKLVFILNWTNEEQRNFYKEEDAKEVFGLQYSTRQVLHPYGAVVYETKIP